MRYAIIENDRVTNVANADYPLSDNWIEDDGTAQIGGAYDGKFYKAPDVYPSIDEYKIAVEKYLEDTVIKYDYKSWLSACAYASTENQYQEQSKRVVVWTAEVWDRYYKKMANADIKESLTEFVNDLPKFEG